VTSLYTDAYGVAVSALGYSISKTSTSARKIVIYLPEKVSNYTLCRVQSAGWELLPVEYIPPPDGGQGIFWRFLDQYTKLRIWTLDREPVSLKSVVYLDADTLVKRNFDELFDVPFVFSASSDVYLDERGFSIGFNAGVLAIKPNSTVFDDMLTKIYRDDYKHNEAEQGFLNLYYGQQVARLPHVYNGNLAIKSKSRTYWDAIQDQMRIVHFTLTKPFAMVPRCGGVDGACTVEEIWDTRRHKEFIETAKVDRDGDFREEIEWWESVYDEMVESVRTDHCSLTE
jgi:alpha-N-acetylglucosamine transferase